MVESQLDIGGGVVFWTLAEHSDHDKLLSGLTPLGFGDYVPEPRHPAAVLRSALEEALGGGRVLVRPLADRDGFTVVKEERGRDRNAYLTDLVARVTPADPPGLDFEPLDDRAALVTQAYGRHAGRVPGVQLSAAMVRVVESLGGTRLRPNGSVYWVPPTKLDEWARVADAVERAADGRPSAVYVLRHRMDADAVRAVQDAVVTEIQAEAKRIRSEVDTGELGGRALETRRKQVIDLRDKVNLYEDILSVALTGLHDAVDEADQAAATAALLAAAEPLGVPA